MHPDSLPLVQELAERAKRADTVGETGELVRTLREFIELLMEHPTGVLPRLMAADWEKQEEGAAKRTKTE